MYIYIYECIGEEIAFPTPHMPHRFTDSYFSTNTGPPLPIQLRKKQKKKLAFCNYFSLYFFFLFFFPVEKPFRSNGPIGEMADWRRFARVTIIYYIGYDRAPPKIKPDIVYLQHALYADRSISFIFFTFRLKLPTHNVFFIHIFLLPFVNHHTHCRFACR